MTIRWLHISDLHLGNDDLSSSLMREQLLEYISTNCLHPDYIFITGDIRTAGRNSTGFTSDMIGYINELCRTCGISIDRLFIVPGNHDVNRDAPGRHDPICRMMFERNGYYDPKAGEIRPDDLQVIHTAQADFRKFLSSLYPPERMAYYENPNAPHFNIETEDFNILHIDSTISYTEKQEATDLIVGTKYVFNALQSRNENKPTIILTHFPFHSLLQGEKKMLSILLQNKGARFWLAGHEHDHILQRIGYLTQLQAGELRYEHDAKASFLIGEYDNDSFRCQVRAYHWVDEGWAQYPYVDLDSEHKDIYESMLQPSSKEVLPLLTRRTQSANQPYINRLTKKLDRSLFPEIIGTEGNESSISSLLDSAWNSNTDCVILIGEGGMGKSTMLLDFCNGAHRPILYISAEQLVSLRLSIKGYLLSTLFDGDLELCHKSLSHKLHEQSLIIIVDGLNEVEAEHECNFINEIRRINMLKGVQILISSRVDFTMRYNLSGYRKVTLGKLEDRVLKVFFSGEEWKNICSTPNLHRLLQNPMLVTIYKEICSVIDDYRDIEFLDWITPAENTTDLFHNYYLAQIALMMKQYGINGSRIMTALICINQILPAIAYRYETSFNINKFNNEFRQILSEIISDMIIDEAALLPVRDHYRIRGHFNIDTGTVSDTLIEELHLLHRDNGMTSFLHQMYRDYLSAIYIAQESRQENQILPIWNIRRFPKPIVRHLNQMPIDIWTGIGPKIKQAAVGRDDASTLIRNLFDCLPASIVGKTVDFSKLDLTGLQLPDYIDPPAKISLHDSIISASTLGIGQRSYEPYYSLRFSPDCSILAAASGKSIWIFNLKNYTRPFAYNIGKRVSNMLFFNRYLLINCGSMIVFACEDSWRYVGEILDVNGHLFSSRLKAIIASEDRITFRYNNRTLHYNLSNCTSTVTEAISVDGIDLTHLKNSNPLNTYNNEQQIVSQTIENGYTATSYTDGRIEIYNGDELINVLGRKNTMLLDAAISDNGNIAVTLSYNTFNDRRRVQIWDISRDSKSGELFCDDSITKIHLSGDGHWLIGMTDYSTWIYDLQTGKEQWVDDFFVSNQYNKLITFGDEVLKRSADGELVFYNLSTSKISPVICPVQNPSLVTLLNHGKLAAVDNNGYALRFNNDRDGNLMTIYNPGEKILAVQVFKTKPFIAIAASTGLISIYHTGTGQRLRKLPNNYTVRLTACHSAQTILAHSDGRKRINIEIFHEKDYYGQERGWWHRYSYHGRLDSLILDMAFNPENNSLIVILSNGSIMRLGDKNCCYKDSSQIITAFNTDAYDFHGVRCTPETSAMLRQNNCFC